jgi:hypothetical protein
LVEFLQISELATISGNVAVGTGTIIHPTAEILAIVSVLLPVLALADMSSFTILFEHSICHPTLCFSHLLALF